MKHLPYKKLEGFKKEHGITNADIAQLLGLSETAILKKNSGASDYYLSEIKKIISNYNMPIEIFLPN